jgi:hypothetical protein
MKPTLTILALFLFAAPPAFAGGDALLRSDPGAAIFVNGRLMGVMDREGKWILVKGLPAGVHIVQARKLGFVTKERKFRVTPGKRVEVVLTELRTRRVSRRASVRKSRPQRRVSRFALGLGGTHHYLMGNYFGRSDLSNIHHDDLVEDSFRFDTLSMTYRPSRMVGIGFSYAYSQLSLRGSDSNYSPGGLGVILSLKESMVVNQWGAHLAFRLPFNLGKTCGSSRFREDEGHGLRLKVETGYLKGVPEKARSGLGVIDGGTFPGSWPFPYTPVRFVRNTEGIYFEVSLTLDIEIFRGFTLAVGHRYFNGPALKFRHQPYEERFLFHGKGDRLSGWTLLTCGVVIDL